ncbi:mitochondrial carrier [Marasmius fiardii PR-910]|nr:mitochondrial carrier [Marasmius fiardii PR-910]
MRWIYPLLLNAASRVLVIPFVGAIIRYQASYNPNYATLNAESGITARPTRTLSGFLDALRRTHRIEGWAGLYKGSMPTILETLIIRGSLAFVKIHPAVPLVLIAAPQLELPESIYFVLFYSLIELPMTVFMIRAITTPYKLQLFSPLRAWNTILSPTERRKPYTLYASPGLFAAVALRTAIPLFFLHFIFDLTTGLFSQELELVWFAAVIVLYVMAFLGSTVLLTPLDVMVVRLSIQRNRGDMDDEPLEGDESEVNPGGERYSENERVVSLRDEYNRNRYVGFMDCFRTILAEEGWSVLFRAWWFPLAGLMTTLLFWKVSQRP